MKKLNLKKRILSAALTGVMALSLAVPAFAANTQTEITGEYVQQEIKVTVPQTGKAIINPLGLDVPIDKDDDTVAIKGQQIVTLPLIVTNNSSMNLSVGATVTGTIKTGSGAKFASATTKATGTPGEDDYVARKTDRSVFAFFQMKQTTLTDPEDTEAVNTEFSKWAAAEYNVDKDLLVKATAQTKEGMATLKPAVDGEPVSGSIAAFRLTGDCGTGTKTGDVWDADADGFSVTVAFTFMPVAK